MAPRPTHNPPNRFHATRVELDAPEDARLEVYEERARSIVTENDSPDVGFRFSVNPYRGCFHGCIYCYARPTHQYLDFGAGTDFDRKIVVKVNAPELLEQKLASRGWGFETIAFSGNTDCYQPLEARYELTRRCLEACARWQNPVTVITKGTLIRRDAALLGTLAAGAGCHVNVSAAFTDEALRKVFDPFAPPIEARFETMRQLAEAGVPVGVAVAPIFPGVNDAMIPELLERAHAAGARTAFMTLARLTGEVAAHFASEVQAGLPAALARKVERGLRAARGGALTDVRFGRRMGGAGARWNVVEQLFELHVRRLGMSAGELPAAPERTNAPRRGAGQLGLDFGQDVGE
ncbi:MAG: radical SAM protein [Sandaracinaceae bacterium]|nr:radical SAM protein [Sandaracinaceae bacterium]